MNWERGPHFYPSTEPPVGYATHRRDPKGQSVGLKEEAASDTATCERRQPEWALARSWPAKRATCMDQLNQVPAQDFRRPPIGLEVWPCHSRVTEYSDTRPSVDLAPRVEATRKIASKSRSGGLQSPRLSVHQVKFYFYIALI